MFEKSKKQGDRSLQDSGKLIASDLGFVDDSITALSHIIHIERHCLNQYEATKEEKWLDLKNKYREIRTNFMKKIVKAEGNGHCISKHLLAGMESMEEMTSRAYTMKDKELGKEFAKYYEEMFMDFLRINGYLDIKPEVNSEA